MRRQEANSAPRTPKDAKAHFYVVCKGVVWETGFSFQEKAMTRLMIPLIVIAACGVLTAGEFNATVAGVVRVQDEGNKAGAKVIAEADPEWGMSTEEQLADFKFANPDLATPTVRGEAISDADGRFEFRVTVTWPEGKAMPVRKVINPDGVERQYYYACLLVHVEAEGMLPSTAQAEVAPDERQIVYFPALMAEPVVEGCVRTLDTLEPVPGLRLRLSGYARPPISQRRRGMPAPQQMNHDFTTDAQGRFQVRGLEVPQTIQLFCVLSNGYAFSHTSKAWQMAHTQRQAGNHIALGDLFVVPGGVVKARLTDMDTGGLLAGNLGLVALPRESHWSTSVQTDADGDIVMHGIPAGRYLGAASVNSASPSLPRRRGGEVPGRQSQYWQPESVEFDVKPGEVTELSEFVCEPQRSVQVFSVDEAGGGIEKFAVTLTSLKPRMDQQEGGRPVSYTRALTVENNRIDGLFGGTWTLRVAAEGYADHHERLELPLHEPVRVTLTRGGKLRVTASAPGGHDLYSFSGCVALHDSPAHLAVLEWLSRHLQGAEVNERWHNELAWGRWQHEAVEGGALLKRPQERGEPMYADNLKPGIYMVVAWANGVMVTESVEVRRAETTAAALRLLPARVVIHVTEKGEPKAGANVHVFVQDYRRHDAEPEHSVVTTDSRGRAVFENDQAVTVVLLTDLEHEWMKRQKTNEREWNRHAGFFNRALRLSYERTLRVSLELHDKQAIMVRVRFICPDGVLVRHAQLQPKQTDDMDIRRRLGSALQNSSVEGNEHWFARIPSGQYVVHAVIAGAQGQTLAVTREIEVSNAPLHEFELDVDIMVLTIMVKAEKEQLQRGLVHVRVRPADDTGQPGTTPSLENQRPDAAGRIVVPMADPGRYWVTAIAYRQGPGHDTMLASAETQHVVVDGNVTVSLDLTRSQCTLHLDVTGLETKKMLAARVFLYREGKRVAPGDPGLANAVLGAGWDERTAQPRKPNRVIVPCIDPGEYTIVLAIADHMPTRWESVKLDPTKATELSASPKAAPVVEVTITNPDWEVDYSQIELHLEDKDGSRIETYDPGTGIARIVSLRMGSVPLNPRFREAVRQSLEFARRNGDESLLLHFANLTPDVTRIHIELPGYREASIDVEPGGGKPAKAELVLEKELDEQD